MTGTVSGMAILFMIIAAVCSLVIPIIILIYLRKKGADLLPFFIGCAVFLVFAGLAESFVHTVILQWSPIGAPIMNNTIIYALYGGLMAGLFEETGRFVAFKTVTRRYMDKNINSLMYGAGHGGCEAVMVLGVTMIGNIVMASMINAGVYDSLFATVSPESAEALKSQIDLLIATPAPMFLVGIYERILAIAIHMSLSVLVWFSVRNGRKALFPLAILLHAIVDFTIVVVSKSGVSASALVAEAVTTVFVVLLIIIARRVWQKNQ
jgi:uncharacterized membrane protein YhfC